MRRSVEKNIRGEKKRKRRDLSVRITAIIGIFIEGRPPDRASQQHGAMRVFDTRSLQSPVSAE